MFEAVSNMTSSNTIYFCQHTFQSMTNCLDRASDTILKKLFSVPNVARKKK